MKVERVKLVEEAVSGMSEDDQKLWSDEVQTLTDAGIKKIDDALASKQEEIMQV